jgi:hypothetical protein
MVDFLAACAVRHLTRIALIGPLAAPVDLYVECWPTLSASFDDGLLGRMRLEALGLDTGIRICF